jgi:hypothetical protein
MPTFRVLRRVDAWIDYLAEFEAENAEAASLLAQQSDHVAWQRAGEAEFWNARFVALDASGNEIEESAVTRG